MWLDAHTHLDSDELFPQRIDVLNRANQAGVQQTLLINSQATEVSFERTLQCLLLDHPVKRFACFGVHPHEAKLYNAALERKLLELLRQPEVIGLGEIGLDFYYDHSPRDVQERVFNTQLELSLLNHLPVVIHCRDAYIRLHEILASIQKQWRGMIHCFTGNIQEMEPLLALGFYISFSGIVTFRKAVDLQKAARAVPLDRILIETDAPFLAPVPYRGKTNEPAYVAETAKFVCALRNLEEAEFSAALFRNFQKLFA